MHAHIHSSGMLKFVISVSKFEVKHASAASYNARKTAPTVSGHIVEFSRRLRWTFSNKKITSSTKTWKKKQLKA